MNLGDWVAPYELPPDNMVHTFYLWRCADITSKVAGMLGNAKEAEKYKETAERTRNGFMKEFFDPASGSYGKYGGNIFALRMGVPDDRKARVIEALKNDINANGGNLDTGIFGTQFFFEVLTEIGLHELAYEAMKKRTMPSYGYWLEQGVTTSWEHWDKPGSGNHPMFGGGMVWLYRKLAGMNADEDNPGYRNIIFHPQWAGDVSQVSYSNLTPYGMSGITWKKENGKISMKISVAVGSTATIFVPAVKKEDVIENGKKIKKKSDVKFVRMVNGYAVYQVGSGDYIFESEISE
jgi:alpha-L-rhamnosidase